jgi:hypothetical protein
LKPHLEKIKGGVLGEPGFPFYLVKTYIVITLIDIIINCCSIMHSLPYMDIGKILLIPTPACIVVLKRKKSISDSNFESHLSCLILLLSKCIEK